MLYFCIGLTREVLRNPKRIPMVFFELPFGRPKEYDKETKRQRVEKLKINIMTDKKKTEVGKYGPIYEQFKDNPVGAIKHLRKMKNGECRNVIYRDDLGYVDFIWGEVTDPIKHKGYGLAHIIDKHENEIKRLHYELATFISIVIKYGKFNVKKSTPQKRVYESETFRFIVAVEKGRNWLLTSFDLIKKPK